MAKRRHKLEDSLRWHQYNFDANSELQWIQEHMPAATSTDYGKNLIDAQNLSAKHKVRERSHSQQYLMFGVQSESKYCSTPAHLLLYSIF